MDDLINQAKQGNREAANSLVREHYALVYRFAARRIGPEPAQDVAQETFLTMHKNIRSFKGSSPFTTWLLGIAHNHLRNHARRKRLDPAPLDEWLDTAGPQPEEGLINRQVLAGVLKLLSEEHRQVVLMHEVEGLKYSEIAEILTIPEGTVKSRLHHAFRALRTSLTEVNP